MLFTNCFGRSKRDKSDKYTVDKARKRKVNKQNITLGQLSVRDRNYRNTIDGQSITFLDKKGNPIEVTMDERISLTPRQCFLLIQNWRAISRRMIDTGTRMFIKLFEENEELLVFFPTVASHHEKGNKQLICVELLEEHAKKVMGVLDQAVHLIGRADDFFVLLHNYADYHAKKPDFKPAFFAKIHPALTAAVKETLGHSYTENMADIYEKVFSLILNYLTSETEALIKINVALGQ